MCAGVGTSGWSEGAAESSSAEHRVLSQFVNFKRFPKVNLLTSSARVKGIGIRTSEAGVVGGGGAEQLGPVPLRHLSNDVRQSTM